jgi:hypothetical protein
MQKSALLAAVQQEIQRHDFSHFVENSPLLGDGRRCCARCPTEHDGPFLDHLAYDAMPPLLDRPSTLR